MRTILIVISFCFCSMTLFPQTVAEDFAMVNNYLQNLTKYSMNTKYQVFNTNTSQFISETEGFIKKDGEKLHNKIGDVEYFYGKGFILYIDNENKNILLTLSEKNVEINETISPEIINNLIKYCKSIRREEIEKNLVKYTLTYNSIKYDSVSIKINMQKKFIKEIIFFYKPYEDPETETTTSYKAKIIYSDFNPTPVFINNDFSYGKYLTKTNGSYKVKSAYSSYKFTNMLSKK